MKENLKEKLIKLLNFVRVVPYQEYIELKGEWEKQNIELDKAKLEKRKNLKVISKLLIEKFELKANYEEEKEQLQKDIEDLKNKLEFELAETKSAENYIKILENKNKKLEKALVKKEKQRHSAASKNGGYVVRIKALEGQVEFLKKHKRAPSLEELKCYTERRKSCKKN